VSSNQGGASDCDASRDQYPSGSVSILQSHGQYVRKRTSEHDAADGSDMPIESTSSRAGKVLGGSLYVRG
jgi:hypothetical protein